MARDNYEEELVKSKQSNDCQQFLHLNSTPLQGLLVVEDKLSMANSLESRFHSWILILLIVIGIDPKIKYSEDEGKLYLKMQ